MCRIENPLILEMMHKNSKLLKKITGFTQNVNKDDQDFSRQIAEKIANSTFSPHSVNMTTDLIRCMCICNYNKRGSGKISTLKHDIKVG